MSRYDGLIIPRSYSEYINKTDAATLQQALQLPGVLSEAVAAGDNKAVTSNAVNDALADLGIKNITIEDTAHSFGNEGADELYAEFDLSSYKVSPCAYIGVLRCGGAQSSAYLFTFCLVISYGNWAFSEISKSWQGANLTFDITTSKLRMTLTDTAIGLYEDSLTLLKIQ